jgi:hypothetical protein
MIAAIPLLLALQVSSPIAAGGAAKDLLHQDQARFCHDPEYPLTRWEHQWCPVVGEDEDCPKFAIACKGPPIETPPSVKGKLGGRLSGKGKRKRASRSGRAAAAGVPGGDTKRASRPPEPEPPRSPAGAATSGLAKIILIVLLAVGVIAVARAYLCHPARDGDGWDRRKTKPARRPNRIARTRDRRDGCRGCSPRNEGGAAKASTIQALWTPSGSCAA